MDSYDDNQLRILEKGSVDCDDAISLMSDFVDGELAPTLSAQLEAHLATCSSCSQARSDFDTLKILAREIPDKPVPRDVRNRLRAALNQRLGLQLRHV